MRSAGRYAAGQVRDGLWGSIWSAPGVILVVCLVFATTLTVRGGPLGSGKDTVCIAIPLAGALAFIPWLLIGFLRYEAAPPEGRVEVRPDALLCRFTDGTLVDLPWSQVASVRVGASERVLVIEHGAHLFTELHGTSAELTNLRMEIAAALDSHLPMDMANRVLRNDGKSIPDWLASVRGRFAPGAYRSGPPPLTRDQLLRVLLCPRLGAEVRIAAAAALSVVDADRAGLSRVRIVTRQVESPALRIAAERALTDALDEAAIAEAAAEAPGARVNQG
ncbi:MAG: hypothetical protein U0441_10155 [Polyangiaceae bacterium]